MCIIAYIPKGGPLPKRETLEFCWESNPHNAGFMYVKDGRLVIHKKEKRDEFLDLFYKTYTPDSPFVMHMRYATHGSVSLENTHPFRVDKTLAFVHNGVIHRCAPDKKQEKEEDISDTRNFQQQVLRKLPKEWFHSGLMHVLLQEYIGQSKIVFLHNSGTVIILNEDKGDWVNPENNSKVEANKGIWYSNDYYKRKRVPDTVQNYYASSGYYSPPISREEKEKTRIRTCHICNKDYNEEPERLVFHVNERRHVGAQKYEEVFFRVDACQECAVNLYSMNEIKWESSSKQCICCKKVIDYRKPPVNYSDFVYEYYDLRYEEITNSIYCSDCMQKLWEKKTNKYGWTGFFITKQGEFDRANLVINKKSEQLALALPAPTNLRLVVDNCDCEEKTKKWQAAGRTGVYSCHKCRTKEWKNEQEKKSGEQSSPKREKEAEKNTCRACGGTRKNSRGGPCIPCEGKERKGNEGIGPCISCGFQSVALVDGKCGLCRVSDLEKERRQKEKEKKEQTARLNVRQFKQCRACNGSGLQGLNQDCAVCNGDGEIEIKFRDPDPKYLTLDEELAIQAMNAEGGNA